MVASQEMLEQRLFVLTETERNGGGWGWGAVGEVGWGGGGGVGVVTREGMHFSQSKNARLLNYFLKKTKLSFTK